MIRTIQKLQSRKTVFDVQVHNEIESVSISNCSIDSSFDYRISIADPEYHRNI